MILINDNDIEQGDDPLSNCCEPIVNECRGDLIHQKTI